MARAAGQRDMHLLFARVSSSFRASDGSGRPQVEATVRRYFAGYERLAVKLGDVEIERAPGAARARFVAELSGQPRKVGGLESLLPSRSTYRFDFRLVPIEGQWLVEYADWQPMAESR
jgi:hypothetical protein